MTDYVLNGKGYGEYAEVFAGRDIAFDPGRLRPYLDPKTDIPCVTINTGRMIRDDNAPGGVRPEYKNMAIDDLRKVGIYIPTGNAITQRPTDYLKIDQSLMQITRKRQTFRNKLAAINTVSVDGMRTEAYRYMTVSDYMTVQIDMDLMTAGRNDAPLLTQNDTPLPFIHADITRGARQLGVWSNGSPTLQELDTQTAGIKIGEEREKQAIGMNTGIEWGTISTGPYPQRVLTGSSAAISSQVYGAITHPARYTKINMTVPTGTNPNTVYLEIIGLIQTMLNAKFTGPFDLFYSLDYFQYMAMPYAWTNGSNYAVNPDHTLEEQIRQIPSIASVQMLDFLTNTFTLVLVPHDSRYVGMIVGADITSVQWPSKGGMQQNWKVFCCEAPYLKFDYEGYLPIYQATTA